MTDQYLRENVDPHNFTTWRFSRNYIWDTDPSIPFARLKKLDLRRLNRDLSKVIVLSKHENEYHERDNVLPVYGPNWVFNPEDRDLFDLVPIILCTSRIFQLV